MKNSGGLCSSPVMQMCLSFKGTTTISKTMMMIKIIIQKSFKVPSQFRKKTQETHSHVVGLCTSSSKGGVRLGRYS